MFLEEHARLRAFVDRVDAGGFAISGIKGHIIQFFVIKHRN